MAGLKDTRVPKWEMRECGSSAHRGRVQSSLGRRETVSVVVCFARCDIDDLVLLKMPQDIARHCRIPNHGYMINEVKTELSS